jgi:hypothetical protein
LRKEGKNGEKGRKGGDVGKILEKRSEKKVRRRGKEKGHFEEKGKGRTREGKKE